MKKKVQNFIDSEGLLTPNAQVIVGVSGGADSVALLHLLHSLGYNCVVAHCNFHLRMEESDRDENFVRTLAAEMKIPFENVHFQTAEYAKTAKVSIEMAARDLRYAWFTEVCSSYNAQAIAIAHHADDSIETLLMHLVRGTGLRGMSGIPVRNGKVIRPLLCCSREEILEYLMKYDLDYVEDSTNALSDYTRNKFRNEVIPLLETINPSVRRVLYSTFRRFTGIQSVYDKRIAEIKSSITKDDGKTFSIEIEKLKQQADVPTVLFELLYPYDFHPDQVAKIAQHIVDGHAGKIFYSDTYRLIKDRKYLLVSEKVEGENGEYTISDHCDELLLPRHLRIRRLKNDAGFEVSREANRIHLDADRLTFPLMLRNWRIGDSFIPFGMRGHKKLSDFFTDHKLSLAEKEQVLVLTSDDKIVWVLGLRTDDRFKITSKTKQVLEINMLE